MEKADAGKYWSFIDGCCAYIRLESYDHTISWLRSSKEGAMQTISITRSIKLESEYQDWMAEINAKGCGANSK